MPAATSCEGGPKTRPAAFSEGAPFRWDRDGLHPWTRDSIRGLAAQDGDM